MEQHLPAELCSLVSLGGVSWSTADFPLLGRLFLILLVWCFPAYPGRNIFSNLRASQSAIEIDEGMDVGLAAASQSGAAYRATDTDLALAELFGIEIGEILRSGNGVRSHGEF